MTIKSNGDSKGRTFADVLELPDPPEIAEELLASCRALSDYREIAFEWYKYVALLCIHYAQISIESPSLRNVTAIRFSVLTGLLNRCSRLMLSNLKLASSGRFGETIAIIDRSIFESAVTVSWLCNEHSNDSFRRYIANGLKADLILKESILAAISERSGVVLPIEKRMLRSIDRFVAASGLSEADINSTKKLNDVATMLKRIGKDEIAYIIGQRMGSHSTHGTWSSLLFHYIDVDDDGEFYLKDCVIEPDIAQLVMSPLVVLDAMKEFVSFILSETSGLEMLTQPIDFAEENILKVFRVATESDFTVS